MSNIKEGNEILRAYMGNKRMTYSESYNELFKVIERLEKEELEDYMYNWEDERGINYNFNGISVDRMRGGWDVTLHLELDPPVIIGEAWAIKDDKEQLFSVLVAAVKKVNEIKNRENE